MNENYETMTDSQLLRVVRDKSKYLVFLPKGILIKLIKDIEVIEFFDVDGKITIRLKTIKNNRP